MTPRTHHRRPRLQRGPPPGRGHEALRRRRGRRGGGHRADRGAWSSMTAARTRPRPPPGPCWPAPPSPGDQPSGQPGQGRGRAHRGGAGPEPAHRLHGRRHGHRPEDHPPAGRRARVQRPGHRIAGAGRLDGGEHLCHAVGHGPAVQPPGHHRHRARRWRTPSAASRPSAPRSPASCSTWSGSTGSPSTSRSWPWPTGSGSGSPRYPSSGATCPAARSTRSTIRSPCSPTSTRSRLGLLATPAVPGIVGGRRLRAPPTRRGAGRQGRGCGHGGQRLHRRGPLPVLAAGRSALVLLPLVDPAECRHWWSRRLRAEFDPLPVTRRP